MYIPFTYKLFDLIWFSNSLFYPPKSKTKASFVFLLTTNQVFAYKSPDGNYNTVNIYFYSDNMKTLYLYINYFKNSFINI